MKGETRTENPFAYLCNRMEKTTVQSLLQNNKINDLRHILRRRECLNNSNIALMYIFHLVQTAGILTTTMAAGYGNREIVWVGAGLNAVAALIHVFENINYGLIKKYKSDLESIQNDTYIDEREVEIDEKAKS